MTTHLNSFPRSSHIDSYLESFKNTRRDIPSLSTLFDNLTPDLTDEAKFAIIAKLIEVGSDFSKRERVITLIRDLIVNNIISLKTLDFSINKLFRFSCQVNSIESAHLYSDYINFDMIYDGPNKMRQVQCSLAELAMLHGYDVDFLIYLLLSGGSLDLDPVITKRNHINSPRETLFYREGYQHILDINHAIQRSRAAYLDGQAGWDVYIKQVFNENTALPNDLKQVKEFFEGYMESQVESFSVMYIDYEASSQCGQQTPHDIDIDNAVWIVCMKFIKLYDADIQLDPAKTCSEREQAREAFYKRFQSLISVQPHMVEDAILREEMSDIRKEVMNHIGAVKAFASNVQLTVKVDLNARDMEDKTPAHIRSAIEVALPYSAKVAIEDRGNNDLVSNNDLVLYAGNRAGLFGVATSSDKIDDNRALVVRG